LHDNSTQIVLRLATEYFAALLLLLLLGAFVSFHFNLISFNPSVPFIFSFLLPHAAPSSLSPPLRSSLPALGTAEFALQAGVSAQSEVIGRAPT
jgi:hypothetical protein